MLKSKKSDLLVWQFFSVCDDPCKAKCKCGKVYTRGRTPKSYSTKSLLDHLHRAHSAEYAQVKQKANKPEETRSNSPIRVLNDKPGSSTEKQPTLTDLVERQQPFGANHPMQRKLSHLVLEWIADALLPYNTVENDAFVRLLKTACPRFAVPSAKYLRTCSSQRKVPSYLRKKCLTRRLCLQQPVPACGSAHGCVPMLSESQGCELFNFVLIL